MQVEQLLIVWFMDVSSFAAVRARPRQLAYNVCLIVLVELRNRFVERIFFKGQRSPLVA